MTTTRRFETIHMDDASVAYYAADAATALKQCAEMNQAAAAEGDARAPYSVWDSGENKVVEAPAVILTKPNTMNFAPLSDPEMLASYKAAMQAWEDQQANAAPFFGNPYSGVAGDYDRIWADAKAWEGKKARVTLKDGTTRQGTVERVTTAYAANGQSGCAVQLFDGYSSQWCGADFLAIEDLTPSPAPEAPAEVVEAPAVSLRIYAACLASYNSGTLHGAWINVTGRTADDLRADVEAMLAASPVAGAEEFAIHDHEGFGRLIGEWTDLDTVASVGEVLAGPHRLGLHWLIEARGFEVGEAVARAEEVSIHQNDDRRWDLAVDWTEDMIAETMDLDKLPDLIRNNIDFKGAAYELTIAGRLDEHSVADERFLVTNADEF